MDKLRVYQTTALGLLLLNIVLVAFIFFAPRPGDGRQHLPSIERFGFDEAQSEQFLTLARMHQQQMRAANEQQTKLLQAYFLQLTTDSATTPSPLPGGITTLEREKINSTYQHFLDLKQILRPEQQVAFPEFVENALQRILLPGSKKRTPPPRD